MLGEVESNISLKLKNFLLSFLDLKHSTGTTINYKTLKFTLNSCSTVAMFTCLANFRKNSTMVNYKKDDYILLNKKSYLHSFPARNGSKRPQGSQCSKTA